MNKPAVILLSGGLDSATTAAIARRDGFELYALSVDYGQRHKFELQAAARVARAMGVRRHVVLVGRPGPVRRQRPDRRDRRAQGPRRRARWSRRSRSPTSRPATRSSCRWPWAMPRRVGAADMFLGVNAVDYSGYPDCRPEFIRAFDGPGQPGDQGRRRRDAAVPHPRAADPPVQGRDHPPGHGAGRRLRPDAHVLRPRRARRKLRPLRRLPLCGWRASPRRE